MNDVENWENIRQNRMCVLKHIKILHSLGWIMLSPQTKMYIIIMYSNALGTVQRIDKKVLLRLAWAPISHLCVCVCVLISGLYWLRENWRRSTKFFNTNTHTCTHTRQLSSRFRSMCDCLLSAVCMSMIFFVFFLLSCLFLFIFFRLLLRDGIVRSLCMYMVLFPLLCYILCAAMPYTVKPV